MASTISIRGVLAALFGVLCFSCLPLRDLDSAASGRGSGGSGSGGGIMGSGGSGGSTITTGGNGAGGDGGGGSTTRAPGDSGADIPGNTAGSGGTGVGGTRDAAFTDGTIDAPALGGAGDAGTGGGRSSGGSTGSGGTMFGTGGQTSSQGGVMGGDAGTSSLVAPDLPDIDNSPVQGEIIYSAGASWDIDGEQWPAFEIHTPTASYWLVKSDAAIVSITDSSQLQWINFSSGFRPNRGVPNLGGCCQPGTPSKLGLPAMSTEVDPSFTVTSSHLRLVSKSDDGSYWLVWDFFLTHFTLTINRSAKPLGFTYRGVPGGTLGTDDQLVLAGGTTRSASNPYSTVLPGPAGWAYLTHPAVKQSLFLIQHSDDALTDTYRIADGDTAMFVFGGGQITQTPIRFSLGLINSCDDQDVSARIAFVQNAIH
jgi:hypothetical protein